MVSVIEDYIQENSVCHWAASRPELHDVCGSRYLLLIYEIVESTFSFRLTNFCELSKYFVIAHQ